MMFDSEASVVCNYRRTFYLLSVFFVFFLYIAPLATVLLYPGLGGVYDIAVTDEKVFRSLICLGVFWFGYVFLDFLLRFFRGPGLSKTKSIKNFKFTSGGWFVLFCYFIYLLFLGFDSGRTAALYENRQVGGGSWLFFAIQLFANAVKFAIVFSLLNSRKLRWALVVIIFSAGVEFYSASGRVNLIINFVLVFLIVSRFKASVFSFMLFFLVILFMPILLNLKLIIYNFSMLEEYSIKEEYFLFDPVIFINNFGHPLISIFEVDGVLEDIGYRLFFDYAQGFLFYLKLFGFDYFGDSITYANTKNLLGLDESIIPPGYMAFGFVQLNYVGVIFSGVFYRFLGWLGEVLVRKAIVYSNCGIFLIAFLAANTFYHGDVRIMVMTLFFVYLIIYIFMSFQQRCTNIYGAENH